MINTYTLHHGDCLGTLRGMADCSVDAVVTDPPYGLSFMGKRWDYDVPSVEIWAECLRVLKPGGHLLAFAGTRTQHRMAVRIEDAGFEIRDMIAWVYSTGFPKSHNMDNHRGTLTCDCALPYIHENRQTKTSAGHAKTYVHSMRSTVSSAAKPCGESQDSKLQQEMQWGSQGPRVGGPRAQGGRSTEDIHAADGLGQPGMEGRCNASSPTRELCASSLCESASVGATNGPQGRLCDGAPADHGGMVRLPADADGVCAPCGPRPTEQRERQPGAVAGQSEPQAVGAWPVCGGCGLPVVPRGLGTALKPALEPITVARKPITGTVAANVLQHGTGALNIDGCRVESEKATGWGGGGSKLYECGLSREGGEARLTVAGRWPANLILSDDPEVVAGFPQTGPSKAAPRGSVQRYDPADTDAKRPKGGNEVRGIDDAGGSAARFFYCAKASKRDRDEGLEGFDRVATGAMDGNSGRSGQRTAGDGVTPVEQPVRANIHPTVKPTDLMAYLVRLVTPPGGIVLDPFMGSGSTGKAAMREGMRFIGCELSDEYLAIARARIEHEAARIQAERQAAEKAATPSPQFDLFAS